MPKACELIAGQIRRQIVRGELEADERLPPEGELCASFGVSRPTLREAFRILEAEGLIAIVRGSQTGARVRRPSPEMVANHAGYVLQSRGTTMADFYEARLAFEPYVVSQLAARPNPLAIGKLRAEVRRLRSLALEERYEDGLICLSEFHRVLVDLGDNRTLGFLNQLVLHLAAAHQLEFARRHPLPAAVGRADLIVAAKSFQKLIDFIEAGDIDRAVEHWRLHLKNANAKWLSEGEAQQVIDSLISSPFCKRSPATP